MSRTNSLIERKNDPQLVSLIEDLRNASRLQQAPIWRDIALRLASPSNKRPAVNLSRIERNAQKDEIILVPGKVLGSGEIRKTLTVAAFSFSEGAREKLAKAGCKALSIRELLAAKPKGSGIRIMG